MQVLLERDRYETIMEKLTSSMETAVDGIATGMSSTSSTAAEGHASKKTENTTATTAVSPSARESRRSSKNFRNDDDRVAETTSKRVCLDIKPSSPPTTGYVSKIRKVGNRCYFSWPGKIPLYYSGIILGKRGTGKEKIFTVSELSRLVRLVSFSNVFMVSD
jgi:hypothetical protein